MQILILKHTGSSYDILYHVVVKLLGTFEQFILSSRTGVDEGKLE